MYSIKENAPTDILEYVQTPFIQSVRFNHEKSTYQFSEHGIVKYARGLHSSMKRYHYPTYQHSKRRRRTAKKGSTKEIGMRVDRQLQVFIECGLKPTDPLAHALILHWESNDHTLIAAQLPVRVSTFNCVTQADILTVDSEGRIWMFEVKTGFTTAGSVRKGDLLKVRGSVANNVYNHWELQRHYTAEALRESGIAIHDSRVINVYEENKKGIVVRERTPVDWEGVL